ncbi:Arginyl-tRNA--protein transferase 1 [Blastocladiella emersonii ATCC 22665]|nr:Arginyl-tRNA--protein transferase 1 [Blastocladiella emersonii ATCC 22665]
MSIRNPSILSPIGPSEHECGYCHSHADTSLSYGAWAHTLRPVHYQRLIDRGWRRSGQYLYKPAMARTCCPQYAIRLDVTEFRASKQHRLLLNRTRRYLLGDWDPPAASDAGAGSPEVAGERHVEHPHAVLSAVHMDVSAPDANEPASAAASAAPPRRVVAPRSAAKNAPFDVHTAVHDLLSVQGGKHTLRTELELASCTPAKFALYDAYQQAVHGDAPGKNTVKSFTRFLVTSPLNANPHFSRAAGRSLSVIAGHPTSPLPEFGTFHLNYYLDDVLIAVSVIDLLPWCVSSVYLFYDPRFHWLSLGKLSALVELVLARDEAAARARAQADPMFLYMGFYVPRCTKMEYKGQFRPSALLDPVAYDWVPLDDADVQRRLRESDRGFATFTGEARTRDGVPDAAMHRVVGADEKRAIMVLEDRHVTRLAEYAGTDAFDSVVEFAARMDTATAKEIVFAP